MSDKRYYWVKLKEGFFDSNEVKILENNKNGSKYLYLFLKLLLLSVNSDGWFITKAGEKTMSWTPKTLSKSLTGFSVKDIREGIDLFLSVGLIYEVDGLLRISNFENYVGSETKTASRMRKSRKKESVEAQGELIEQSNEEESSASPDKALTSFYPEKKEGDSNHQTNVGVDVQSSSCINNESKNNTVQLYPNSKAQKPIDGGFPNKKIKEQYQWFEGQLKVVNGKIRMEMLQMQGLTSWYDDKICARILGIAREISRHEHYIINSAPISSDKLLESIVTLVDIDGKRLFNAFQKLDELLETTEIKNVLLYTITFLYNESFGCSQKVTG